MQIRYISYGDQKSGGAVYENILLDNLASYQTAQKVQVDLQKCLLKKSTNGINNFRLITYGFQKSIADINVCVSRTALGAIARNLFSSRQIWVVLHNYDPLDGKQLKLKLYFSLLFFLLRIGKSERIKVITVSPFFKSYFEEKLNRRIDIFPNLFDTKHYLSLATSEKKKKIHLGQWSSKNDPSIFIVAKALHHQGYECFFTTMIKENATVGHFFSIKHYPKFESYLAAVSESEYTLALTRINEGWNRIAHESILLGTPVIGYGHGGLGNLLSEAKQVVVSNYPEVLKAISQGHRNNPPENFIEKYDYSQAELFLQTIFS